MSYYADITRHADLDMLTKERLIGFLRSGHPLRVEFWNAWRHEGDWELLGWQEADLSGADLRGVTLSLIDLTKANLSDATLDGAQLNGTLLRGANLSGASLVGASLREADLTAASLRGADLSGVDLGAVKTLDGAAWLGAKLREAAGLDAKQVLGKPIGEESGGRHAEAVEAYRALRFYFESRGEYRAADRAHRALKRAAILRHVPVRLRRLCPRRRFDEAHCQPSLLRWLGLVMSGAVAGHGTSLLRPAVWLAGVVIGFGLIYLAWGLITDVPGCGFLEFNIAPPTLDCQPSRNLLDALAFSLGSLAPGGTGVVQPYLSGVWIIQTIEGVIGFVLLGVWGYAIGRRMGR